MSFLKMKPACVDWASFYGQGLVEGKLISKTEKP
jgi:hypothetical protein